MYYIRYINNASPVIKEVATKEEAAKFVANYTLKHQFGNTDDNWIDMVFEGNIIYNDPSVAINGVKNGKAGTN